MKKNMLQKSFDESKQKSHRYLPKYDAKTNGSAIKFEINDYTQNLRYSKNNEMSSVPLSPPNGRYQTDDNNAKRELQNASKAIGDLNIDENEYNVK